MKKIYYFLIAVCLLAGTTLCVISCKKDNKNDEGQCLLNSGFSQTNTFLFWVSKDYGGGPYTLTVVNTNSQPTATLSVKTSQLSVYESVAPDACNDSNPSYLKHAIFYVPFGYDYNWTATSDNKTYHGTVHVPCDATKTCYSIQIDGTN